MMRSTVSPSRSSSSFAKGSGSRISRLAPGLPDRVPGSLGVGFYASSALTILAFFSALISLMPFNFNKKIEEKIDNRLESSKKRLSKVGHGINDELHKIGKHSKSKELEVAKDSEELPPPPLPEDKEDASRFMPQGSDEENRYGDYMPK